MGLLKIKNLHAAIDGKEILKGIDLEVNAINFFKLSPRAYDRILKVTRTIADLAGTENIAEEHLYEAVNYRGADRTLHI